MPRDAPEFVAAVKATGKKQLIIAGTITSVCMAFPCIAAAHDGYQVFAVIDASGTYSKMAQEITLARVVQAGVVPMDTAAVCSELQLTWNRDDALQWAENYAALFPSYQLLIESFNKAQEVATPGKYAFVERKAARGERHTSKGECDEYNIGIDSGVYRLGSRRIRGRLRLGGRL